MLKYVSGTFFATLLLGALIWVTGAMAQQAATNSGKPNPPVIAWNGSYRNSIPIEVPTFRGLEPHLSLSYDSSRGVRNLSNPGGLLGIGWSMDALSYIERMSGTDAPALNTDKQASGHGVPAYGLTGMPADSFALDGEELIACTQIRFPATSPSCLGVPANGYAARIENFQRIRQDASANTWEVTAKDGTKSLYTSLEGGTSATTFRWHLQSVTDRRGNHIDYSYSCNAAFECTIASISYKNQGSTTAISTISFAAEAPTDITPATYATGKDIRSATLRLRAIRIYNGASLVRAYALNFTKSLSSGQSRLISVQQYGKDATPATGIITGGTSLPPFAMIYSNLAGGAVGPTMTMMPWTWNGSGGSRQFLEDQYLQTGDFNGDGLRNDFFHASTKTVSNLLPSGCTNGFVEFAAGS